MFVTEKLRFQKLFGLGHVKVGSWLTKIKINGIGIYFLPVWLFFVNEATLLKIHSFFKTNNKTYRGESQ